MVGKNWEKERRGRRGGAYWALLIGIFIAIGMTLVLIYGRYIIIFVNDSEVVSTAFRCLGLPPFQSSSLASTLSFWGLSKGGRTRSIMALNLVRLCLRVPQPHPP